MKNAILLHGKPGKEEYYDPSFPSPSNFHWFPWLQKQLLTHDVKADTPEVPFAYDPQWELWCREVERYDFTPETLLVGHSCGGGFWMRYLSEHPELKLAKLILVAPSLGIDREWGEKFFGAFEIDPKLSERIASVVIFNSDNDDDSIQKSVKQIQQQVSGTEYREFHLGHFTHLDMNGPEFPELLEECLK